VYKTYQHFPTNEVDSAGNPIDLSDRLAIRFRKIPLDVVGRETPEEDDRDDRGLDGDTKDALVREIRRQERRRQRKPKNLIPFTDVSGYEGVFVLGASPLWIMGNGRGMLRVHPMICDGRIGCFTQFHNLNCKHGFITLNADGNLRISQLPSEGVQYDMPWPLRKVPLKRTVRRIRYHPTSQTYVTVTAVPDPFILKEDGATAQDSATAGTNAAADASKAAAAASTTPATATANGTADLNGSMKAKAGGPGFRPLSEKQTLELVSPVTWETVDRYELNEYELVTSIETVSLESSQDASGRKKFIAVGTSYIKGEDSAMRGTVSGFIKSIQCHC